MIKFKKVRAGLYIVSNHDRPNPIIIERDHQGLWYFNEGFTAKREYFGTTLSDVKFRLREEFGENPLTVWEKWQAKQKGEISLDH